MDAMSDAIEGAAVMLYGVSLKYKESANVRHAARCPCLVGRARGVRGGVGWVRITAIRGTIFLPQERQYASPEAFGTVSI